MSSTVVNRCLRTIAQYDGANEHLFYSKTLTDNLKQIRNKWIRNKDIQNETKLLWYMLHRDTKPDRPIIDGKKTRKIFNEVFCFVVVINHKIICFIVYLELRNNSVGISWKLNADSWDDNDLKFRIILSKIFQNKSRYCE